MEIGKRWQNSGIWLQVSVMALCLTCLIEWRVRLLCPILLLIFQTKPRNPVIGPLRFPFSCHKTQRFLTLHVTVLYSPSVEILLLIWQNFISFNKAKAIHIQDIYWHKLQCYNSSQTLRGFFYSLFPLTFFFCVFTKSGCIEIHN